MSGAKGELDTLLGQAKEHEQKYDWRTAAEIYSSARTNLKPADMLRVGTIEESRAYALHRYAFQARTSQEFRSRITAALEQYSLAKESHCRFNQDESNPWSCRCDAMIALEDYWLASNSAEKRPHIEKSWSLATESMGEFRKREMYLELARTYVDLSFSGFISSAYSYDFNRRKAIVNEALETVEVITDRLDRESDSELAAAMLLNLSVLLELWGWSYANGDERLKYHKKALEVIEEALHISEESVAYQLPVSWGSVPLDTTLSLGLYEKTLSLVRRTGDALMIGRTFDGLATLTYWRIGEHDTYDEQNEMIERATEYAREAREAYSNISFKTPNWNGLFWIEAPEIASHGWHAFFQSDIGRRREYALKGLKNVPRMLEMAKEAEYPEILDLAYFCSGRLAVALAMVERNEESKREMLHKAVEFYAESTNIGEAIEPAMLWNRGFDRCETARITHELSLLGDDVKKRRAELSTAIDLLDEGVGMLETWNTQFYLDKTGDKIIGMHCFFLGDWLLELHDLDGQESALAKSIDAYCRASRHFEHGEHTSRAAESWWSAARVSASLGDHSRASNFFKQASENYSKAVGKVPRLREMYEDHSRYMNAWHEIELARLHHLKQDHSSSGDHYEKAATLLASTRRWSFLSMNYRAWSSIEAGEELSRAEKSREAIIAFGNAEKEFEESKKAINERPRKVPDEEEDAMVSSLAKTAGLRVGYCEARAVIEEAKLLDRQGQESASSERYGLAVEMLDRIRERLEDDDDRREIGLLVTLAKAWQKMTLAESETSPNLFAEAAELFEQAKDLSSNDKAKSTAMGHSRFCRALEAGTRFSDTCEASLHAEATKHLERAAKHYLKAGHENASEYAHASKLLFDGYVYMDKASREEDQGDKAKLYALAEKVLEASASSYEQAKYPGKKEEVRKLLAKVRRDRQLALSLTEALRAPDIVSTTTGFDTPIPTHETATGLERFEHADVQAAVIVRPLTLNVGDALRVEIELVNAGKGLAQLTKLEEVIPSGFEVTEIPPKYKLEDSYLNLRGKHLDALKTEDISIAMKPRVQGRFTLKPRIMYLDESGKYRSHEPEPVEIKVKELGISGWLKGPDPRR